MTFDSDTTRAATAAAFVRAGLVADDKIVYLADVAPAEVLRSLAARQVDPQPHLATGRLVVHGARQLLSTADPLGTDGVTDLLQNLVAEALEQHYSRLWVVQELSGLLGTALPAAQLRQFEAGLTRFLSGTPALALCQYDGRRYTPDQLTRAEDPHTESLTPQPGHDDGLLRIQRTRMPTGLRLVGEVDVTNRQALADALEQLVSTGAGDGQEIYLDVSELQFIDVDGAGLLVDAATSLRPAGRRLVLDGPAHSLRRTLDLYSGLPGNVVVIEES